jgi:hypothetical protein
MYVQWLKRPSSAFLLHETAVSPLKPSWVDCGVMPCQCVPSEIPCPKSMQKLLTKSVRNVVDICPAFLLSG